ncbi:hypothetical protein B0H14DRAFT_2617738 [Mycena olivaceomarginata]|nr:hypothetical protein B0H14DRAFT_2617738 [Mycena olivaceomarginata]
MLRPSSSTRRKGALRTEAPPRSPHNQISTPKNPGHKKGDAVPPVPSRKTPPWIEMKERRTHFIAHNGTLVQLSPAPRWRRSLARSMCGVSYATENKKTREKGRRNSDGTATSPSASRSACTSATFEIEVFQSGSSAHRMASANAIRAEFDGGKGLAGMRRRRTEWWVEQRADSDVAVLDRQTQVSRSSTPLVAQRQRVSSQEEMSYTGVKLNMIYAAKTD